MNTIEIVIILLFGIITFISLFIFNLLNKVRSYKNKIIDKFQTIKDLIKERIKIIEDIVLFLKVNCPHEDNIIKLLTDLTTNFKNTDDINKLIELIIESKIDIKSAVNLENTYLILQEKEEYLNFKKLIGDNDDKINFAASVYNDMVDEYNNFMKNKYISILNKIKKFPTYNQYK